MTTWTSSMTPMGTKTAENVYVDVIHDAGVVKNGQK